MGENCRPCKKDNCPPCEEEDCSDTIDLFAKIPPPPWLTGEAPAREPKTRAEDPDGESDVDCDGIPDWEEMEKVYANGKKTDPRNRDTDGDGIWDGVEIGRYYSPDPLCENYFPKNFSPPTNRTDPTRADTDCDGLADGYEDRNRNGKYQPRLGETDPTNVDSDDDGLWDGLEKGLTQGILFWDHSNNTEVFVDEHPDNCPNTRYAAICAPGIRRSITDPTKADTDGDGLSDGLEDKNKNGCFEPDAPHEETDPLTPDNFSDTPEILNACSADNLVKIDIRRNFAAQIALGLPMGFANSYVDIERGNTRGLMGFDASRNIAFVAWQHTSWQGMSTINSLATLQQLVNGQIETGLGVRPTIGPFTSWDTTGTEANAFNVNFQLSSGNNMSPAARVNDIASRLLGVGNGTDILQPPAGTAGATTQYVRAQYVLRDNGEVIVVMAVALDNDPGSASAFGLEDVAGGAALARYFDRTVVQCETGIAVQGMADIIFVVDDSGSMGSSQHRLSAASEAMASALSNSSIDWRVAVVTSSYHLPTNGTNRNIIRGFTRDPQQFQAWLRNSSNCVAGSCSVGTAPNNYPAYTSWDSPPPVCGGGGNSYVYGYNGGCWIGTNGYSYEGLLGAARRALVNMSCSDGDHCLREEADIVVVLLGDAEDQTNGWSSSERYSWENIDNFIEFFQGRSSRPPGYTENGGTLLSVLAGKTIRVNAVYCPAGVGCGDDTVPAYNDDPINNPNRLTRIQRVVQATNGISTDIRNQNSIATTIQEVVEAIIGTRGVVAQKPFIGASLRVAIRAPRGECRSNPNEDNGANVPRSRENGFDYNGMYRTISFFGECRPPRYRDSAVAISYRAWEASDESRWPCENDVYFDPNEDDFCKGRFSCDADVCICPNDCGGCGPRERCDTKTCSCVRIPD
ncbi:MAG: adventurous gliding motility lipoprotein CglD [Cystobacterineae bacterium]|nr:adventurous gliding motility lipoprotein CglD [Cystobacterineae bacterium]